MTGRVVDIAQDGRHISLHRGFLVVEEQGRELGRVPLDDIAAVIANAHGITWSNAILVEAAQRGIPVILCAANHHPAAILWPSDSHHEQSGRMADQAAAPTALKKNLWAEIVRAKIQAQGATLAAVGAPSGGFHLLSRKVRSGDPDNVEAQAARRYWPLLFGEDFRRDRDAGGINALLNYGYAILRGGVARSVMASGLHPSLGLMHCNRSNAFVLVDDLMEPFRPLVDREVWRLSVKGLDGLTRETKAHLAGLMIMDLPTRSGTSPLMTAVERLAQSLARAYAGNEDQERKTRRLDLPLPALPLEG